MTHIDDENSTDIMSELRLRMWARKNYIPAAERNDGDWHPAVVNEMHRRDLEVAAQQNFGTIITSTGIVPLEPSRHDLRLDQSHARVPAPKGRRRNRVDSTSEEVFIPHYG